MALSRAVFGQRGNLFPGALIWVARWGWETINAVSGAYAVLTVLDLAGAQDPVSFIGELLPVWIAVPYLLISLIGMLLINSMSMYSADFTAQTLGIKVPRAWAVSVNAVISLVFGFLLMVVATSFF